MRNEAIIKKRPEGINWHTAIFIGLFHLGAVAAISGLAKAIKFVSLAQRFLA